MAKEIIVRTAYEPKPRVTFICTEPTLTQQHFQKECDINVIMAKYATNGVITHLNELIGRYGDFTAIPDYQGACDAVMRAQDAFMAIDANIRARFNHNPGEFIEFIQNPANADEIVKLGLATARQTPEEAPIETQKKSQKKSTPSGGEKGGETSSST